MTLLAADEITLHLGKRTIFDHLSLGLDRGDRLGVVGPNGSGKSTLLRVLTGALAPDGGRVASAKGIRLGYLPQELSELSGDTLLGHVLERAPGRNELAARIGEVEEGLASTADEAELLELSEELADLHHRLSDIDHMYAPHRAQRILVGLGFEQTDFERPVSELSGGWRMRAALAGLLFQRPDVLLLDEPTNHLDMPSVAWLNRFLDSYRDSLVLICHDREFLNRHINRVASFEVEGLRNYRGNYDAYRDQRVLELDLLENRVRKDEQRKKELEAFVTRFKAKASKARQAQSKAKLIEKLQEGQVEVPKPRQTIALRFAPVERAGDQVMTISELGVSYGDRNVFDDVELVARRQDRIAIVGVNGAGKTTLLRTLAGEIKDHRGSVDLGAKVKLSYFAQHHADLLGSNRSVLEEVSLAAPKLGQTEVRGILGAFLFSGDEVEKPVSVLSGGERARVALAKLLADPGNVLLLDEPTNHLDTESAEKLTESLAGYDGTILFVSHNLDFARRLSSKVWDVHHGRVEEYPGSLGEYLDQFQDTTDEPDSVAVRPEASPTKDKDRRKEDRERARRAEADLRKKRGALDRKIEEAEKRVARLEAEQSELEEKLGDPRTQADPEDARSSALRYEAVQDELSRALETWERLSAERAALENEHAAQQAERP